MDQETQIKLFNWIPLLLQIIGGIFIIFKVGRYTGNAEAMFKNLAEDREKDNKKMEKHFEEDRESFEKLNESLANLRVVIAGGGSHGRRS